MKKTTIEKQEAINDRIDKLKEKALISLNKIIDLQYKSRLLGAKSFHEREENFGTKKEPVMKTVRYIKYPETYTDDDTGESIIIERNEVIEVDGRRCDHFGNPINLLTPNDIQL